MAFRSWVKLLATTTGAAAVVGAGQLGLAYGLSMVRLDRDLDVTASDQWTFQLAWVAWFAMTAAAVGAIVGTGFRPRWLPSPLGSGGALGVGLAAGLGALAVLPLTMQPARSAQVAGVDPVFVIGVCAVLGAAVGVFAAWSAAARAVARWNIATVTVLVWIVALISIAPSLLPDRTPAPIRLGVLDGSLIPAVVADRTPFVTMPLLALLSGLVLGWIARGHRMPTATVALTGLAGPALLTISYLIAGPGETTGFAFNPYWGAMIASGAGVLGSVLAVIVRGGPQPSGAATAPAAAPATAPDTDAPAAAADDQSREPAVGHAHVPEPPQPALPRREATSSAPSHPSAIAAAAAVAAQRPEAQLRPSDTGVLPVPERPHPLADLANQAPPNSPFTSGTGSPFGQSPQHPNQPHPGPQHPNQPHPGPQHPNQPHPGQHPHQPHPQTGPQAQHQGQHQAQHQPDDAPRFSGQRETAPSPRRGWRTRRPGPENPPASPAGGFDGFATGNPGPRTGIDTAEHPRITASMPRPPVVEPTSISAPPHPRGGRGETEYVDWVNGLGGNK
jgi:hypothetical protein